MLTFADGQRNENNPFAIRSTNAQGLNRSVPFRRWFMNVACLDAVMPTVILAIPRVSKVLFPGHPNVIVFLAVALPISAFLFRLSVGLNHINSNSCGGFVRFLQYSALATAAVLLIMFDTVLVMACDLPGAAGPNDPEYEVVLAVYTFYFLSMLFAMYPGRC